MNNDDITKHLEPYQPPRDYFTEEDDQQWEITKSTFCGATYMGIANILYLGLKDSPVTTTDLYRTLGMMVIVGIGSGIARSLKSQ